MRRFVVALLLSESNTHNTFAVVCLKTMHAMLLYECILCVYAWLGHVVVCLLLVISLSISLRWCMLLDVLFERFSFYFFSSSLVSFYLPNISLRVFPSLFCMNVWLNSFLFLPFCVRISLLRTLKKKRRMHKKITTTVMCNSYTLWLYIERNGASDRNKWSTTKNVENKSTNKSHS